jgi:hypothetical protein
MSVTRNRRQLWRKTYNRKVESLGYSGNDPTRFNEELASAKLDLRFSKNFEEQFSEYVKHKPHAEKLSMWLNNWRIKHVGTSFEQRSRKQVREYVADMKAKLGL